MSYFWLLPQINSLFAFLSVDMEILTLFSCASRCTWPLQGVRISISTDRNVHNLYSNMTSINGYISNTVIKHPIYFNSHMRIDEQIINIIHKWIRVFIQNRSAYIKQKNIVLFLAIIVFRKKKYLRQPSIDFALCNCCLSMT